MTEALDHIEHCDVLITGCLMSPEGGGAKALGLAVSLDDDLSALDLLAVAEALVQLANQLGQLSRAKAGAN